MQNTTKAVHESYHKKTKPFKQVIKEHNFTYRLLLGSINSYITKPSNILDVGCGAGSVSLYLASNKHKVLGLDISKKAVRQCIISANKLGLSNASFKQADFPNIEMDEKFDVVIFTEVIEHLLDDKLALQKIETLLKNKGIMILSTPSKNAPLHKIGMTRKFDRQVGHLRRYELKSLEKMIRDTGFSIIQTRKTEGIVRNFLFINPYAGKLVRFLNYSKLLSNITTFVDSLTIGLLGASNYIIIARKKGVK